MATILLIIIYVAFIGLGIPDSLFGTAWPAIYNEFSLPISFGSFITVIVSCGTVISSLMSAKIINKFGTNKVCAFSTLFTAAALIGFSVSPNIWIMCVLAILLGIGAGAIDIALNNYVSVHYSARDMSFLHCFYGIGVSVSPYILSMVMSTSLGWRGGYKIAFFIQILITLILFFSLPLWKKAHGSEKMQSETNSETKALSFFQTLKVPGVKLMCCLFITSCAIEASCGALGSTFLVEYKHIPVEKAAQIIMLYYVGITAGRFLSGVFATKFHSWQIVKFGEIILGIALLMLFIPGKIAVCAVSMFLIGLGNGPLFPNLNYLAPESFGADISSSVIGAQMSSAYIGIMLAPALCGILGQTFGMVIFPFYLLIFFVIMFPATFKTIKITSKK